MADVTNAIYPAPEAKPAKVYGRHITFMEERRIFAILERNPEATDEAVAKALECDKGAVYRFRRRNNLLPAKPVKPLTFAERLDLLEAWAKRLDPSWFTKHEVSITVPADTDIRR